MKRAMILASLMVLAACPVLSAGPINGGPFWAKGTVEARSAKTYVLLCRKDEDSAFESKTNFDGMQVIVVAADGEVLCNTHGPGGRCYATWYSPKEERVFVIVFNRGEDPKAFHFTVRNGR
jgi:hypothetical protein